MATSFSELPIVDLGILSNPKTTPSDLKALCQQLHDVFATTGFAYLTNAPLSFSHQEIFDLASDFFGMDEHVKMRLAKQTFVPSNKNTYRGYFPPQAGQQDNLKEGFEIGPAKTPTPAISSTSSVQAQRFQLGEKNVWPDETAFPVGRARMEKLYAELQTLASTLLSLLAVSLDKPVDFFSHYFADSLSTLRLLHYPPQASRAADYASGANGSINSGSSDGDGDVDIDSKKNAPASAPQLCCTPHTDSGILTLLHQDPTGGLEVRNANGEWIPAPYVAGSLVVNIGDLLAEVSGGRFVATMHRVRATSSPPSRHAFSSSSSSSSSSLSDDEKSPIVVKNHGLGRLSVPFFFEPGEHCVLRSIDGRGHGVVYGAHVRRKMSGWVEFQDQTPLPEHGLLAGDDAAASTNIAVMA